MLKTIAKMKRRMSEIKGRIYKICNTVNDKVYVGQTVQTLERRFGVHQYRARALMEDKYYHTKLYNAMAKYGIENFYIELIEEVEANDDETLSELLDSREIFWISEYDSYNNGYNTALGGHGKFKYDYRDEVLPLWQSGHSIYSIVAKTHHDTRIIRRVLLDNGITMEEIRERSPICEPKKIYAYDMDGYFVREFKSIWQAHSELNITTANIQAALRDRQHYTHGYQFREYKQDRIEACKEKWTGPVSVHQYDICGNFIASYTSLAEATRTIGLQSSTSIIRVCEGKKKTCGGYQWSREHVDRMPDISSDPRIKPKRRENDKTQISA